MINRYYKHRFGILCFFNLIFGISAIITPYSYNLIGLLICTGVCGLAMSVMFTGIYCMIIYYQKVTSHIRRDVLESIFHNKTLFDLRLQYNMHWFMAKPWRWRRKIFTKYTFWIRAGRYHWSCNSKTLLEHSSKAWIIKLVNSIRIDWYLSKNRWARY